MSEHAEDWLDKAQNLGDEARRRYLDALDQAEAARIEVTRAAALQSFVSGQGRYAPVKYVAKAHLADGIERTPTELLDALRAVGAPRDDAQRFSHGAPQPRPAVTVA